MTTPDAIEIVPDTAVTDGLFDTAMPGLLEARELDGRFEIGPARRPATGHLVSAGTVGAITAAGLAVAFILGAQKYGASVTIPVAIGVALPIGALGAAIVLAIVTSLQRMRSERGPWLVVTDRAVELPRRRETLDRNNIRAIGVITFWESDGHRKERVTQLLLILQRDDQTEQRLAIPELVRGGGWKRATRIVNALQEVLGVPVIERRTPFFGPSVRMNRDQRENLI